MVGGKGEVCRTADRLFTFQARNEGAASGWKRNGRQRKPIWRLNRMKPAMYHFRYHAGMHWGVLWNNQDDVIGKTGTQLDSGPGGGRPRLPHLRHEEAEYGEEMPNER